eukprot:CAMPEP_0181213128 /NCGR_PEP_ID=MMETSP1096-20121128/24733_1 /TAXON_ID=156174 ORGANISM="Chrysochromulina ericina, Strain CCMP281" /NCGR_SAMPLE_ID=MMETSP1096 /ASSEMBLY_ACC=CAM_ASM_000453 /LENGTH=337 /DNA_ID=CAMNT_0023304733 /DNA_START=316 /DNA_END=1333 /DNA_ORIENTATION=-
MFRTSHRIAPRKGGLKHVGGKGRCETRQGGDEGGSGLAGGGHGSVERDGERALSEVLLRAAALRMEPVVVRAGVVRVKAATQMAAGLVVEDNSAMVGSVDQWPQATSVRTASFVHSTFGRAVDRASAACHPLMIVIIVSVVGGARAPAPKCGAQTLRVPRYPIEPSRPHPLPTASLCGRVLLHTPHCARRHVHPRIASNQTLWSGLVKELNSRVPLPGPSFGDATPCAKLQEGPQQVQQQADEQTMPFRRHVGHVQIAGSDDLHEFQVKLDGRVRRHSSREATLTIRVLRGDLQSHALVEAHLLHACIDSTDDLPDPQPKSQWLPSLPRRIPLRAVR